jgi:hypothetical protein
MVRYHLNECHSRKLGWKLYQQWVGRSHLIVYVQQHVGIQKSFVARCNACAYVGCTCLTTLQHAAHIAAPAPCGQSRRMCGGPSRVCDRLSCQAHARKQVRDTRRHRRWVDGANAQTTSSSGSQRKSVHAMRRRDQPHYAIPVVCAAQAGSEGARGLTAPSTSGEAAYRDRSHLCILH